MRESVLYVCVFLTAVHDVGGGAFSLFCFSACFLFGGAADYFELF